MDIQLNTSSARRLLVRVAMALSLFEMVTLELRAEGGITVDIAQDREVARLSHYLSARGFADRLVKHYSELTAKEKEIIIIYHHSEFQIDWIVWMIKVDNNFMYGTFDPSRKNDMIKGFSNSGNNSNSSVRGEPPSQKLLRKKTEALRAKEIKNATEEIRDTISVVMGVDNLPLEETSFSTKREKSIDALVDLLSKDSIFYILLTK